MSQPTPTPTARKPVLWTCTACPRLSRVNHSPRHCRPRGCRDLAQAPQITATRKRKRPASVEAEERKVKTPDRAQKGNGEAATDGGGEVEVTLKMVYDSLRRLEELVRRLEGARLVVAGEVGGEDDEGGENWEDWDESQSVLTEFGKDSRIHLRGVRRLVEDVDAYEVITEEEEKEDAASEEDDPDWEEADLTTDKARRGYEGDEHGRDEVCAACGREYENEYADLEIEENVRKIADQF
ncbi:hypothetical protein BZA05DRAFT_447066 [Tricharina praecox]|uniref:uncharacterized protein n=1 Tax=Tricharina praecox TaxID=43433 RepID=UPI002220CA62|nr:uncharacterized protein BZA05DRAFT_447066 [Tricharina praecox]KAI5847585.1 hypothetical protein BZA05DRAFT_447066 [Tricharina praecox]